ncbi:MAG: STAS domain-containing protein [Actinomycetota bacterium]
MQIVTSSHHRGSWTILTIAGELDVVGGPDLRQAVMAEVQSGHHRLILDLTGVDFLDSFGLGVIVGALKRTRLLDGDLRIVVPEARLRRVFEVCDLDRVFDLHLDVDGAVGVSA